MRSLKELFTGKEKKNQDFRRGLARFLNMPFLVDRSGIMWTEESKQIQIFPLPKPALTPRPVFGEGVKDYGMQGIKEQEISEEEMRNDKLRNTIFVQGQFESDSRDNIQLSSQRVKASVFGFLKAPPNQEKRI